MAILTQINRAADRATRKHLCKQFTVESIEPLCLVYLGRCDPALFTEALDGSLALLVGALLADGCELLRQRSDLGLLLTQEDTLTKRHLLLFILVVVFTLFHRVGFRFFVVLGVLAFCELSAAHLLEFGPELFDLCNKGLILDSERFQLRAITGCAGHILVFHDILNQFNPR